MKKRILTSNAALQALGQTVKALRERRGLSQEAFAERAEVHRNYVGRIERAELDLSFYRLHRVARALGMTVGELCRRAGV